VEDKAWIQGRVLERLLKYVRVDSPSDGHLQGRPTTPGQLELLRALRQELASFGVSDTELHQDRLLIARLPGTRRGAPTIGFMAHVDTVSEPSGTGVKPIVHERYDGRPIELAGGRKLDPAESPALARYAGATIVTSDGTTILGADDKAGVAELMTAAEVLASMPARERGPVELFFTSDEETGAGMHGFPMDRIRSTACYTLDGEGEGGIEAECFNAYKVRVAFTGQVFHLGSARGRLVNAVEMAAALVGMLPRSESPQATDDRFGYYCPYEIKGNLGECELTILLRDFEEEAAARRVEAIRAAAVAVERLHPGGAARVEAEKQYANMRDKLRQAPVVLTRLEEAVRQTGMTPEYHLIRGGTDGARLTEMGVPTPNIFDGGFNYHSVLEWAAVPAMVRATEVVLNLVRLWAEG
jgi:tripeptide aminopeptidase